MLKNLFIMLALLFSVSFSVVAIEGGEVPDIGALFPMTGPNEENGRLYATATEIASALIRKNSLLPMEFEIRIEDSQGLPAPGVVGVNKLISIYKTPYVLTSYTGTSKAIAPVIDKAKVVAVNGGASGPDLADLGPYFWNIIPLSNHEMHALVPYLVDKVGLKRIAVIYMDDPLGESMLQAIVNEADNSGATIVAKHKITLNTQDFRGLASRIRATKPDVTIIATLGASVTTLIKQLHDGGVGTLASYAAFNVPSIARLPEISGSYYTLQHYDWNANEITRQFLEEYKKHRDDDPNVYVINYVNATYLYALLAEDILSNDEEINGESLLAARQRIRTFDLVGGPVVFDDEGVALSPIEIRRYGDNGPEVVDVMQP